MVQVHHDEGVAHRIDPESCADAREGIGEALTGERKGQPLSRDRGHRFDPCRAHHEARERARAALQNLLATLDAPQPAGMGHNNPPEEIGDAGPTEELREEAIALHAEFGKSNPSISLVKMLGTAIGKAALASIKWAGRKIDLAVDTAITKGIPTIGPVFVATYNEEIHKVIEAVRIWLEIVAHRL
jgi:hypothetical protein